MNAKAQSICTPPADIDSLRRLGLFARMFKDLMKRRYRVTPWRTIISFALAAVYWVTPFDALPEIALGPLGLIDDIGVLAYAWSMLGKDTERYKSWLQARPTTQKGS